MKQNNNDVGSILSLLEFLNDNGDISYDGYSKLFDAIAPLADMEQQLKAAKDDIAALLWLNGSCEYCAHGIQDTYCGATRWRCKLGDGVDCRPEWRGITLPAKEEKKEEPKKERPAPSHQAKPKSRVETMFGPKETWTAKETPKTASEEFYKGFLIIKCKSCGEVHSFCSKKPISESRCSCGAYTPLRGLVKANVACKCGKVFRYRTNLDAELFSYNCLECGAPVDLTYNKKENRYDTIR